MASIDLYRNSKGEDRYQVRYRKDKKQTSKRGFKTQEEAELYRELVEAREFTRKCNVSLDDLLPIGKLIPVTGYYVYFLYGSDLQTPFYIGSTRNLFSRIGDHFYSARFSGMLSSVSIYKFDSEDQMLGQEMLMIKKYQPKFNTVGKTL